MVLRGAFALQLRLLELAYTELPLALGVTFQKRLRCYKQGLPYRLGCRPIVHRKGRCAWTPRRILLSYAGD